MDLKNKVITLKNGKEYLVIEQVIFGGYTYAYLVNDADELDTMFCEIAEDGKINMDVKNTSYFKYKVFPLFVEKFKQYDE